MENFPHHESIEDCADLYLGIKHHNRFQRCGSGGKFLHCGTVEWVQCRGSIEDCANPLLVSSTIINSYAMEVWRSSYNVEVWKGSYTVEASKIVLIRCWALSTIMIPTSW